ncbi:MAG: Rieske 2Fe-2S domain-containing protein [Gammaproteobacteria bacterium]|nr:Rieske 2Fe-2S domain-containing protein [Gammaproteobacteria bacterium]
MSITDNYNQIIARLIDDIDNKTTDQAPGSMQVPTTAYTDADIWQQEMDLIFKKVPVFVALTQEIPNPGDYKTMQFLDKPLLITRLKDGTARVMLNVCPHRAMAVANKPCGNQSRFTCPYHGWMFTNNGTLRGVADQPKFGDFDKQANGLHQLPVYERSGMIFTVLEADGEVDFDGFLGGIMEDVGRLGMDKWHYCGKREIFGANWKIAYDGYLEGYHFAAAHPDTIAQRTFSNVMEFGAYGPHTLICFPHLAIKEKLADVPPDEFHQHENNGYDWIRTLFPNVSIFVAPEITMISQIIPGPKPNQNTTYLNFIHPSKPVDDDAELETMMDWLRDVVDTEDYHVGLAIQKGLEAHAFDNVTFGRNERGNQLFHKYVDWYLANDPNAAKPEL